MRWVPDPDLAEAARAEIASREKYYPAMIEAGEIAREAAGTDLAAWRGIAAMFVLPEETGPARRNPQILAAPEINWAALETAAERALDRLASRAAAAPADAVKGARLEAVRAIYLRIFDARRFWTHVPAAAPREAA